MVVSTPPLSTEDKSDVMENIASDTSSNSSSNATKKTASDTSRSDDSSGTSSTVRGKDCTLFLRSKMPRMHDINVQQPEVRILQSYVLDA